MAERVLLLPPVWAGPRAFELIPALRYALDELRSFFEVEVLQLPCWKGVDGPVDVEGVAELLRTSLTPGCHLVDLGLNSWDAHAILALDRATSVASFVSASGNFQPPTLRGLEMDSLAEYMSAAWTLVRMPGSFAWLLLYMQGAGEADVKGPER